MKTYLPLVVALMLTTLAWSQPTITSFTPASGPIGTSVAISGTGFSTTIANNLVYFGAVRATVTAATTTQLTVTVPAAAMHQPISVTVAGLKAYSVRPFVVAFGGSGISTSSFAARVSFATGIDPAVVALGDLDGDGEIDVVVPNNDRGSAANFTASFFRNQSTGPGSIAYSTKADVTVGSNPIGAYIGDIDGDGLPDLVVANFGSGNYSIFRNTSTSGTISFAARIDLAASANPYDVIIRDIDGDGKADLVVVNLSSNMVIYRNTGSVGTISFASPVGYSLTYDPVSVTVGDLDGDAKPEIALAAFSGASSYLTLYRNTSTPGTISMASPLELTPGSQPRSVAMGDIDGDGKSDLAVANGNSATMSVFRNTSSVGSLSFATKVDFTTGTGPFSVSFGDIDGDSKVDLATANFTAGTVSVFRNNSTSGTISLASKVDFTAGTQPRSVFIADQDGNGKNDLVTANFGSVNFSVFRNTVPSPQTITFGALPTKTFGDADFTLSASASSGLPVTLGSDNTAVANVTGNTVQILGAGTCNIVATQAGNSSFSPAPNVSQLLVVNKANQTITFGAIPSKVFSDPDFALGGTSSSGLAITYTSSNTAVATVSGNTVTITGVGSTTITASQPGNTNFNPATSVSRTLTVNKATQTITFNTLPTKAFGDANFALGATASSGLVVSYNSSNTSVATISGSTVTIVGVGSSIITASQAGDANYIAANSVQQTLTVNKANQTITFNALPTKAFGDAAFALGATSSAGLPVSYTSSNTAVATVSGSTVTIVGAGSTNITASQAGNTNVNPASNIVQTLTVNKANQTITFNALPSKTVGDANFNLTATSSSGLPVSYSSSATVVATISGSTVTIVGGGSTNITASQAGNVNYNPASPVVQALDVKVNQTITFNSIPVKTFGDAPFALSATASSGLPITFISNNTAIATVSGNTLTIVGAGSTTISASQAGSTIYNAAPTVLQTLTVNKANQSITFNPLPEKNLTDAPFTLLASASSGLPVTFSTTSPHITLSGNQATIVSAGRVVVDAAQAGNTNYNTATSVSQAFCIKPAKPVISITDPNTLSPTLTSNSATGIHLWYRNGSVIPGANTNTYETTEVGVYSVQVVIEDCPSDFSDDFALIVTGDIEPANADVQLFPNPSSEWLTVSLIGLSGKKEVALIDMNGRALMRQSEQGNEAKVYVGGYGAGTYIVSVKADGYLRQFRFVKY